jgi:hypothetical protein
MDNTAIQAGSPPLAGANGTAIQAHGPRRPASVTPPRPPRARKSILWQGLECLADLRITVTLFVLSLFLVFWGTLAQVDKGIWTVVAEYFRCFVAFVPLKIVFFRALEVPGSIPYPGGLLLGALLLVNLLSAHVVSFKLTWKRSGILLIHTGIVVMMIGELVTFLCAVEGHMHIVQGGSSNFIEHSNFPELAVVETAGKQDQVTVIPTARLRRGGLISDDQLPFDVEVVEYMVNSLLWDARPEDEIRATRGQGKHLAVQAKPEGTGVDKKQMVDAASMIATLKRKGTGEPLGTFLLSVHLTQPDWVEVDGKRYQVSLRFKRSYRDYTFRLDKLNVSHYPNTDKPKDYSSFIHLDDDKQNQHRDVRIFMNNPLTYAGETFYQIGVDQQPGMPPGTTLQVMHNPGWMLPYISCFLVAGGMLFHFGLNLFRFIERRAV